MLYCKGIHTKLYILDNMTTHSNIKYSYKC